MSSLESAICFSLILVLLAFMITGPEAIALDSFQCAKDGGNELFYMERDRDSDNFRLIYGSVFDLSNTSAGKEASDENNQA